MSARSLRLVGGRVLAWREYGDLQGFPVIFLHGGLNSRMFEAAWDKTAAITAQNKVRLLALDRPGYGQSTFQPDRTYLDAGRDIAELSTHLSLQDSGFAVLGFSSGGPNALAVAAAALPGLTCCGVISGDGPYAEMEQTNPGVILSQYHVAQGELQTERGSAQVAQAAATMLRETYESLRSSRPDRAAMALLDLETALEQGHVGAAQDSRLETSPWPFDVATIRVPVFMWHGTADTDVPHAVSLAVRDKLLEAGVSVSLQSLEGESHSLIRRQWGSILQGVSGAKAAL